MKWWSYILYPNVKMLCKNSSISQKHKRRLWTYFLQHKRGIGLQSGTRSLTFKYIHSSVTNAETEEWKLWAISLLPGVSSQLTPERWRTVVETTQSECCSTVSPVLHIITCCFTADGKLSKQCRGRGETMLTTGSFRFTWKEEAQ